MMSMYVYTICVLYYIYPDLYINDSMGNLYRRDWHSRGAWLIRTAGENPGQGSVFRVSGRGLANHETSSRTRQQTRSSVCRLPTVYTSIIYTSKYTPGPRYLYSRVARFGLFEAKNKFGLF